MRILLLTTHMNLGGIGMYVFSLAGGLARREHQVCVASSGGDLVNLLASFGVPHLKINIKTKSEISPKVFRASKYLLEIIKERKIEIIHAHTRVTQVLAQLVSQRTKVPYVSTAHGFFKLRLLRRIFPCWGQRTIAISEAVREHLVNDLGVKKINVAVVHNGIEIERFSPAKFSQEQKDGFKRGLGLKRGPIVGTVARLSPVKGQRYLIAAMPLILSNFPDAQLLLIGDGPDKEELQTQVRRLQIEDKVKFIPATLDTSVPLSIMDIFAFPSISEGLGLAIIEAQAMALPVVASDTGGIYTLVKDGRNGFLVHPKDAGALAEAILKLLRDKKQAKEFGLRARDQVKQNFNLRQMVEDIEKVYAGILKK